MAPIPRSASKLLNGLCQGLLKTERADASKPFPSMRTKTVAIVADFNASNRSHLATNQAIQHSSEALGTRVARESRIPLLGTCGGFQHIVLEYARNVLGIEDADHEETNPQALTLVISRLDCSLVGRTMTVSLQPGSRVASLYGRSTTEERYLCNFGVNPSYADRLASRGLRVVGSDAEGVVRVVELEDHPFFVGTLFLPQLSSKASVPHPIVSGFLRACL